VPKWWIAAATSSAESTPQAVAPRRASPVLAEAGEQEPLVDRLRRRGQVYDVGSILPESMVDRGGLLTPTSFMRVMPWAARRGVLVLALGWSRAGSPAARARARGANDT
jgi:hypothetical protein